VRLERRGVPEPAREETIERLTTAGYIDDARFAAARARVLADRGVGDAVIRADLEERGVASLAIDESLAGLEPEAERARREAARLGGGTRALRALVRKGFGEHSVGRLLSAEDHLLG
jgi:regulatory protein